MRIILQKYFLFSICQLLLVSSFRLWPITRWQHTQRDATTTSTATHSMISSPNRWNGKQLLLWNEFDSVPTNWAVLAVDSSVRSKNVRETPVVGIDRAMAFGDKSLTMELDNFTVCPEEIFCTKESDVNKITSDAVSCINPIGYVCKVGLVENPENTTLRSLTPVRRAKAHCFTHCNNSHITALVEDLDVPLTHLQNKEVTEEVRQTLVQQEKLCAQIYKDICVVYMLQTLIRIHLTLEAEKDLPLEDKRMPRSPLENPHFLSPEPWSLARRLRHEDIVDHQRVTEEMYWNRPVQALESNLFCMVRGMFFSSMGLGPLQRIAHPREFANETHIDSIQHFQQAHDALFAANQALAPIMGHLFQNNTPHDEEVRRAWLGIQKALVPFVRLVRAFQRILTEPSSNLKNNGTVNTTDTGRLYECDGVGGDWRIPWDQRHPKDHNMLKYVLNCYYDAFGCTEDVRAAHLYERHVRFSLAAAAFFDPKVSFESPMRQRLLTLDLLPRLELTAHMLAECKRNGMSYALSKSFLTMADAAEMDASEIGEDWALMPDSCVPD